LICAFPSITVFVFSAPFSLVFESQQFLNKIPGVGQNLCLGGKEIPSLRGNAITLFTLQARTHYQTIS
jgi:hypothetical protein